MRPSANPLPPAPTPVPAHRRHHSEIDMSSLRRISEALLLAQNRARHATERANRSDHLLRVVLAQVDVPTLNFESLADWELLQSSVSPNVIVPSFTTSLVHNYAASSPRRHSFGDEADYDDAGRTRSVPSPPSEASSSSSVASTTTVEVARTAKDVVASLHAAVARHQRCVERLLAADCTSLSTRHTRWSVTSSSELGLLSPLSFVAGLLAGVVVGVTFTKQLLRVQHGAETPTLVSKLAKWCSQRASGPPGTAPHLMPYVDDELSYLLPPAVEVI